MNLQVTIFAEEEGRNAREYSLDSDLKGEVSFQQLLRVVQLSLVQLSYTVLADAQAAGFEKNPIIAVDNKVGKAIENVNPFGKVQFIARANSGEILRDLFKAVLERSPEDTGLYIRSHILFYNDRPVATELNSLNQWLETNPTFKNGDLLTLVNIQPYARRLERLGVTKDRQQSRKVLSNKKRKDGPKVLAPNGTYYLASRSILRKYKFNSSIKFTFISGQRLGLSAKFKTQSKSTRKKKPARTYLYPAIEIRIKEGGIL